MTASQTTTVHLLRHGEVENPTGVLYGRLPGFVLSDLGRQMATRVAEYVSDFEIAHLRCSPLERAQETMAPIAEALELPVITDGRVIEADNFLEGNRFDGRRSSVFTNPRHWFYFRNPLRPSWGEPYIQIAARMRQAMADAVEAAAGREALIVSHQLPIWVARMAAEGRRFAHDPRRRQCTLASLTSFTFVDGRVAGVRYAEPVSDLLPAQKSKRFVAGA
jgi:broad specificity phosphatase PhoE